MAGDFPIRVKSITKSAGKFTGTGLVAVPYLKNAGISVTFNNILINTDKKLAEGVVVTT